MPDNELKCIICARQKARADCEVLKLSTEEQLAIRASGERPPAEIAYCRPCYRLISNPEKALDLLKGMYLMRLKAAGVPNAEAMAEEFKTRLSAKAKK